MPVLRRPKPSRRVFKRERRTLLVRSNLVLVRSRKLLRHTVPIQDDRWTFLNNTYASSEGCIPRLPQNTSMLEQDPSQATREALLPSRPRTPLAFLFQLWSVSILCSQAAERRDEKGHTSKFRISLITTTIAGTTSTSLANFKAEQRVLKSTSKTQNLHLQCLVQHKTQVSNK
jgi:hypothetical protein